MKYQALRVLSFAIFSSLALPVYAQGIILNNNDLRTDLNWLNQQGVIQISTSTWPLSGDAGAGNFQAVIINCIIVLTHILLCLIYFLTRIPKAEKAFEYSNLVNFMIIAGSLSSISFTVFTRFFSHISLFTFVYIMIFIIFISKNKIVSFALSLILLVNFLLIDGIRKDSLLNGSPIAMVTVTPLQIFLYSDMEYREMLKNINYHGDIIND